jgi:hypothetical protein
MPGRCVGIASQSHIHTQNQIDHERAALRARQPGGAGAAVPAHPLRLSGRDSIWKLRLLGHRPGGVWNAAYGPPPESADDNGNLDADQRRQWRSHWGLPGDWRPA